MSIRDDLLARIDGFLARTGMTDRRFGVEAVGDHKFLKRLRGGAGITLTSIERAEAFMREPAGTGDADVAEDAAA